MKRRTVYDLTHDEEATLKLLQVATELHNLAQNIRHRALIQSIEHGLPVRLVGIYGDYSAAQVSRLSHKGVSA